ncbi:MAG: DUF3775 domain-containing protein [Pikeienuella sp.]
MLTLPLETVGWIIVKAREVDVKDVDTSEDGASDDDVLGVLEDRPNDASADEVKSWIDDLNDDHQAELVALFWLGRDGSQAGEFQELLAEARGRRGNTVANYLLGSPLLADYLEAGLELLGINVNELESGL